MPLYLVRWPDLSAALVKARSEDELIELLDEVANPDACTWSPYRGPLFLEFSLPAKVGVKERSETSGPLSPEDVVVEDVSGLMEGSALGVAIADGDTGFEMSEAIEAQAFPHVFKARQAGGGEPTEAVLREAVKADLQPLVRASWKLAQVRRRGDLESRLAADMDAPAHLVRRWVEMAKETPPPATPKGGKKRRR